MFVVTNRDLQTRMKEIRARVNEGEDAIYHSSKGTDDLVIVSLHRYNQMLDILYMEHELKENFEERRNGKTKL
jgi:PHD/YefM family antitoxin component YafN of YafNO toxin-antitoxin module